MLTKTSATRAFTLMELMAALAIIALLAVLVVPRAMAPMTSGKASSCHTNQGEIELQTHLWKRINGSYPASNLSDIGADLEYFPEGLPTCPVDGTAYTIDTSTGLISGHEH